MAMFIGLGTAVMSVAPLIYKWYYSEIPVLPPDVKKDIEMYDRTQMRSVVSEISSFDLSKLKHAEKLSREKSEDPLETALKKKFKNVIDN
jgi:hypothetical protein